MAYLNISPFLGGYLNITEKVKGLEPRTSYTGRKEKGKNMGDGCVDS